MGNKQWCLPFSIDITHFNAWEVATYFAHSFRGNTTADKTHKVIKSSNHCIITAFEHLYFSNVSHLHLFCKSYLEEEQDRDPLCVGRRLPAQHDFYCKKQEEAQASFVIHAGKRGKGNVLLHLQSIDSTSF